MWPNIIKNIKSFFVEIAEWISFFFHIFLDIVNYKIFEVDNDPFTLKDIILGVILFWIGLHFIRRVSRQIESKILNRLDIDPPVRHSLKTFIFYLLLFLLILFVLRLLNIPVTMFTILGGALAVGLGLGSQKIVYDFLSGVVIIIEHPIRSGDLIEMNNIAGRVENIGARATRVLTLDNKHLIVPNSHFLTNTVLNWTLSDEVIRGEVKVGVMYGSPTEQVDQLMIQAAKEHSRIEDNPSPQVFLSDFGDSSLVFILHFYCRIGSLVDMRKIKSDLRFKLVKIFRENNIVIAYPQRDIHVINKKQQPLQVQIYSEDQNKK